MKMKRGSKFNLDARGFLLQKHAIQTNNNLVQPASFVSRSFAKHMIMVAATLTGLTHELNSEDVSGVNTLLAPSCRVPIRSRLLENVVQFATVSSHSPSPLVHYLHSSHRRCYCDR